MAGHQQIMVRGKLRHHPVAVWNPNHAAVHAIRVGVTPVAGEFALDDRHGAHVWMEFGQRDRPLGEPGINRVRVFVYDRQHLFPEGPLGCKGLRHHAEETAMRHKDIVARIARHLRERGNSFVLECRLSHEKGVQVGHHDGRSKGAVQDQLAEHRHHVRLAPPDQAPFLVEEVPRQTRRAIRERGLIQAVDPHPLHAAVLTDVAPDRQIHLHRRQQPLLRQARADFTSRKCLPRLRVRHRFGLCPELLEAPLFNPDPELGQDPVHTLAFPPVEPFENRGLHSFPRVVLVHNKLLVTQLTPDRQCAQHGPRVLPAVRRKNAVSRPFTPEIRDDFPVPH